MHNIQIREKSPLPPSIFNTYLNVSKDKPIKFNIECFTESFPLSVETTFKTQVWASQAQAFCFLNRSQNAGWTFTTAPLAAERNPTQHLQPRAPGTEVCWVEPRASWGGLAWEGGQETPKASTRGSEIIFLKRWIRQEVQEFKTILLQVIPLEMLHQSKVFQVLLAWNKELN